MSLLELKDVTVSFPFPHGRPPLLALDGLTLSVEQGELVALVGPSGCGKTTALNVLAGQVRPTSGQVRLAGEPVEGMLPSVGYISQADTLLPWRTVEDNVALAMELRGVPKAQRRETARALMAKPALILADEPTGILDSRTSADVLALLQGTIRAFSQTLVMITHNPEIAQLAHRIVRIEDGRIVE